MPRVLFVTHNVPRFEGDAAGSFVLRLAVALQQQGARVEIIAPGAPGLAPRDVVEGVHIERVRYGRDEHMTLAYTGTMAETVMGSWRGRWSLLHLLWQMRAKVRARLDEAKRNGDPYDVLHVHWWFPSGLAMWKALKPSDPCMVITMHGSDVRLAAKKPVVHPIMRSVLGQAAARTAVSSWLADIAQGIAPAGEIQVAPMPVDTRHFDAPSTVADGNSEADAQRNGVLFVGRLNAQKGLADLLQAMASPALRQVPLRVVGDGPESASLMALTDQLQLTDRIQWLGTLPQSALVPLYKAARAVVMPSRGEGLGLVAVEAQLCGTPVIGYADGGLLDVVRPSHGGTLVQTGDVASLAIAIARVVNDPANAERLGQLARVDMLARFTTHAVADRYLSIYRHVTDLAVRE
ncbi:glycosyltransferase [Gemmatimonas sp.]